MKEMIYKPTIERTILHSGTYKNHNFFIISQGTNPTAYVEYLLNGCSDKEDNRTYGITVHGGFTFYDLPYWDTESTSYYLGWDYAQLGDYYCDPYNTPPRPSKKKWTTEEIFTEVKNVIDQLVEIEERRKENEREKEIDV